MTNQSNSSAKQSNTTLIIGIVAAVIIVAALAFWLFSGRNSGGSESAPPAATATPMTDAGAVGTPAIEDTPSPSEPEGGAGVDAPAIQNITWIWVDRSDASTGVSEAIADPAQYTLFFQPDGTYQFQADCNSGAGTYTADQSGAIRMTAGPMTMAECGESSRSLDLVNMMQAVQDYRLEEDGGMLILVWPAGGPEDGYRAQ